MANIIIATPDIFDLSGIVSIGETKGNKIGNLQTLQPGMVWRSSTLNEIIDVTFDSGALSGQGINTVWLGYTNFSPDAEWRVRASDINGDFSSPTYDSGRIPFCPVSSVLQKTYDHVGGILHFNKNESIYWKIEIFDDTNLDLFLQAGRMYLSNAFVPKNNFNWGWGGGIGDPSPVSKGESGATFPLRRPKARSLEISFSGEEDDVWGEMNKIDRLRGTSRDVLICIDHEKDARILDWTTYGLLRRPRLINNPSWELYEKGWTLEELLP